MRLRRLDQHPRAVLIVVAVSSAAAHSALSLLVRSPLYTPDEWLYAELSRSILNGHPGEVVGAHISLWSTTSYVGPAITAPLWLIHDVAVAYHLSLAVGSVGFALAVFPAYALARAGGVGTHGALAVAACSQLVPAGAFTATLLAEPYVYPAVLAAVLLAVDAVVSPTPVRIASVLAASAGLGLIGGLQFLVFPAAVAVALVGSARSPRAAVSRALMLAGAAGACLLFLREAGGRSVISRIEAQIQSQHYSLGGLASWYGVNVFVLALASGWVIIPAAVVGIGRMLRTHDARARSLAWVTAGLAGGALLEAAVWGENGNGLYERFTFYVSPLLLIASLRELSGPLRRAPVAVLAYGAALAAILLPLTSFLVANAGQSPTLFGLTQDRAIRVAWPVAAAALAVLAAGGTRRGSLLLPLAATALVVTSGLGFEALLAHATRPAPDAHAGKHSTLLVNALQVEYGRSAAQMLFWNPQIDHIVVMGRGGEPDLPASLGGMLTPSPAVATSGHGRLSGPFVVGDGVSAWRAGHPLAQGDATQLGATPDLLAFGWGRDGSLLPYSDLLAAGSRHGTRLIVVRLTALTEGLRLIVDCTVGRPRVRTLAIPRRGAAELRIVVPPGTSQSCRLSPTPGYRPTIDERKPVARASLVAGAPAPTTAAAAT